MIPIPGQPPMAPPMMGAAQPPMMGGMPPPELMGLFGLISGLAGKPERTTPMDDMRRVIELLEQIRERDPEKTGMHASMAISLLTNGPEGLQNRQEADY